MIEYKYTKEIPVSQLKRLYNDVGWTAYTKSDEVMKAIIPHAFDVITAWDKDELVGLTRSISDGVFILYIQDVLVKEAYQGKGIGSALLTQMVEKYPDIRQKVLLTDFIEDKIHFYEKNGFKRANSSDTGIALVRIEK